MKFIARFDYKAWRWVFVDDDGDTNTVFVGLVMVPFSVRHRRIMSLNLIIGPLLLGVSWRVKKP